MKLFGLIAVAMLQAGRLHAAPLRATPLEFHVDPRQSQVTFTSQAPLEEVVGTAQDISGTVRWDPAQGKQAEAQVTVRAGTMKTGNRLRDKHMRNEFLHTDQFPDIRWELIRIASAQGESFQIEGRWTLHGVTRTETAPVQVRYEADKQLLTIQTHLTLKLSDFQIERPQFLWMRLAETVEVSVVLRAVGNPVLDRL